MSSKRPFSQTMNIMNDYLENFVYLQIYNNSDLNDNNNNNNNDNNNITEVGRGLPLSY